ncbi:hypothetical protein J3E69DRAFT_375914 [Trichoderma sp. SZMC 28015]
MSSQTSVGVVALDSAGKKRSHSESFDRSFKKLKSWPSRLSFSLQSSVQAAQSSFAASTISSGIFRSSASPDGDKSDAQKMVPSLGMQVHPNFQQLEYLYRHREKIPRVRANGSRVYVFPCADECISVDHYTRFPVIQDIFKQNIQEYYPMALKHPAKTEYRLKMCGISMESAKPSILIYHPQADKKTGLKILELLNRPQVREQYNSSNMIVCFEVYWFSGPAFRHFGRPMDGLSIRMRDSYIPGALLSDNAGKRISTLTCGIKFSDVDDIIFVLTTAHAFEEEEEGSESDTEHEGTVLGISLALNGDEDGDGDIYRFGDIEYDMAELTEYDSMDEEDQACEQQKNPLRHGQGQSDHFLQTSDTKVVINPNRVWGRSQEPEWDNDSNLDWALIEIEKSDQWEANEMELVMHDIPGLGYQKRDVRVITSQGSLDGIISNIPSFIANSNNLYSLCKVWTVSLEDPSKMSVGDSGALVIDSLTEKAYGYVIGINHFQELYVIPLQSVLDQIYQMLPISNGVPEIFMALDSRPGPPPKDYKHAAFGFASHLNQYWPRTGMYNTNGSFSQPRWEEAESFGTAR